MPHRPWPFLGMLLLVSVLLLACSSTPPTSQSNQSIVDARNSFKASDFMAALRNLDKAIKSAPDEASRQQAVVLRIALVTALADANKQMADAYYLGAKQPAAASRPGPFYKIRSDYLKTSSSYLMDAMQSVMDQRSKLASAPTSIEVSFPGFMGTNPGLAKVKTGQFISDSERMTAEAQADRNSLAVVLAELGGAGQDPDKGQQVYSGGKVDVDPRVFIIELTNSFLQIGGIYDLRSLNQPDRQATVTQVVHGNLDVATKLLAAKPDKDLDARVKKILTDCDKGVKKSPK